MTRNNCHVLKANFSLLNKMKVKNCYAIHNFTQTVNTYSQINLTEFVVTQTNIWASHHDQELAQDSLLKSVKNAICVFQNKEFSLYHRKDDTQIVGWCYRVITRYNHNQLFQISRILLIRLFPILYTVGKIQSKVLSIGISPKMIV